MTASSGIPGAMPETSGEASAEAVCPAEAWQLHSAVASNPAVSALLIGESDMPASSLSASSGSDCQMAASSVGDETMCEVRIAEQIECQSGRSSRSASLPSSFEFGGEARVLVGFLCGRGLSHVDLVGIPVSIDQFAVFVVDEDRPGAPKPEVFKYVGASANRRACEGSIFILKILVTTGIPLVEAHD